MIKFVVLPILSTLFIHFVQDRLGELRSRYLGLRKRYTSVVTCPVGHRIRTRRLKEHQRFKGHLRLSSCPRQKLYEALSFYLPSWPQPYINRRKEPFSFDDILRGLLETSGQTAVAHAQYGGVISWFLCTDVDLNSLATSKTGLQGTVSKFDAPLIMQVALFCSAVLLAQIAQHAESNPQIKFSRFA